jgi:hypothetical protein
VEHAGQHVPLPRGAQLVLTSLDAADVWHVDVTCDGDVPEVARRVAEDYATISSTNSWNTAA